MGLRNWEQVNLPQGLTCFTRTAALTLAAMQHGLNRFSVPSVALPHSGLVL